MVAETTEHLRLLRVEPTVCPICGEDHTRYDRHGNEVEDEDRIHRAAHCCLWKTHDHAARVRIAGRIEDGSNWAEAIQGEAK